MEVKKHLNNRNKHTNVLKDSLHDQKGLQHDIRCSMLYPHRVRHLKSKAICIKHKEVLVLCLVRVAIFYVLLCKAEILVVQHIKCYKSFFAFKTINALVWLYKNGLIKYCPMVAKQNFK